LALAIPFSQSICILYHSFLEAFQLAIDLKYAKSLIQMGMMAAVQGDLLTAEKYYLAALESSQGGTDPTNRWNITA